MSSFEARFLSARTASRRISLNDINLDCSQSPYDSILTRISGSENGDSQSDGGNLRSLGSLISLSLQSVAIYYPVSEIHILIARVFEVINNLGLLKKYSFYLFSSEFQLKRIFRPKSVR